MMAGNEDVNMNTSLYMNAGGSVNGKSFVKVRKIKKQVLLEQNFDRSEFKSLNIIGYPRTAINKSMEGEIRTPLSNINMINTKVTYTEPKDIDHFRVNDKHGKLDAVLLENNNNLPEDKNSEGMVECRNVCCEGLPNMYQTDMAIINEIQDRSNVDNNPENTDHNNVKEEKESRVPKISAMPLKDLGRRRDSVVAMSTRKISSSPSMSKLKIRKTSFVAPRTSARRKSSNVRETKVPCRRTNQRDSEETFHQDTRNFEVGITMKQCGDKSTITVNIDSIVSSLGVLYPSSVIEVTSPDDQCMFTCNTQVKSKGNSSTANMPPRNESPITINQEKSSITEIIKEMKQTPNNVSSQIRFCRKMAIFANDDSLHVLLAKQEGISHIIKSMTNFKENHDLIKSACQTLLRMTAVSDANCVHIYKGNGISLLIDLLQLYIDEAELLLIILDILGHLSMSDNTDIVECMLDKSCHTIVLTTMSRHDDSSDIVKQCCFILSHLVNTVETARSLMFIGGVHVIIGVMQRYKDHNEVLENGCRALGSFAVHDEICMDVVHAGAVKIVLNALERSDDDEYLLECATWGLACLTKYEETCQDICDKCAIQRLVNAMKKYPTKETIQEYGCWCICNVIAHDTTLDINISHSIVDVLLDATSMFIENIDLQEQILFTVSNIITTDELILHRFVTNNGVALTIKTMTQYPDHCPIQEHGCRIIGNTSVQDKHRLYIEMEGGSKAIVSAMLTLDNCDELQEVGCLALTNITANVYKNKVTAVKNGCVTAVLKAIGNNGDCEDIVLSGLKTICNVIEIDEACYHFIEENGIQVLSSLLSEKTNCVEDIEILLFAANALSRISSILGIETNHIDGAEQLLFRIKDRTGEDPEAILCICRFYEHLLQTEIGYRSFRTKNAEECVYHWIDTFTHDINIQTSCCKIIAAMALYDKESYKDYYNVLAKCMETFTENGDIQLICCGAIVYIADKDEMYRDCLVQKGAATLVMNAIKENISYEKIVDVGLMALDALVTKTDLIDQNTDCTLPFLLRLLQLYPDNTEIQIHGCRMLSKLRPNISDSDNDTKEDTYNTCDHIVTVIKRRRSNAELQAAAIGALQCLLNGEPESVVQNTREQLIFLKDEWSINGKFSRTEHVPIYEVAN